MEQQAEPFGMRELGALRVRRQLGESASHAGQPELVHLLDSGVDQQGIPPQW
jgi:hypothetical protein